MDRENRRAPRSPRHFLLAFGLGAFYLPTIMLAVGNHSTVAAGIFAVLFVAAFFLVFWLRGRSQRNAAQRLALRRQGSRRAAEPEQEHQRRPG